MKNNPVICAIDTKDINIADEIIKDVGNYIGYIKVGLEYFLANGSEGVDKLIKSDIPVFLDLKFHDIPNTVYGAVSSVLQKLSVNMLTVHSSGGKEMMNRAVKAANESSKLWETNRPMILGVTILTSLSEEEVSDIGFNNKIKDQVMRLVDLSVSAGVDGCVCSPHEISLIRKYYGKEDLKLIVPGIRTQQEKSDDQERFMTPSEAMEQGADYIVIGRPITKAADRALAARNIMESIT